MKNFYEMIELLEQINGSDMVQNGNFFIEKLKNVLSIVAQNTSTRDPKWIEFDNEASDLLARMEDHYVKGYVSNKEEDELFNQVEKQLDHIRSAHDDSRWYG